MTDNDKQNIELSGAEIFSDWAQLVGEGSLAPKEQESLDFSLDSLAVDGGETHWLQEFQKSNLMDMDLVALELVRNYVHDFVEENKLLKETCRAFLTQLALANLNELRVAGISENQIEDIAKGMLPVNWTVHLKYPLAYGGQITIDNLVLIPHNPFHEMLHSFVNRQIVTDAGVMTPSVLYMPVPKSAVYVPFGTNQMADHVVHFKEIKEQAE